MNKLGLFDLNVDLNLLFAYLSLLCNNGYLIPDSKYCLTLAFLMSLAPSFLFNSTTLTMVVDSLWAWFLPVISESIYFYLLLTNHNIHKLSRAVFSVVALTSLY